MFDWLRDSPFGTATWVDWVDVGILAWVIYRGLLLIRGTRAFLSLLGLVLAAVVYLLSGVLGLAALHWVLDNLFVWAFLGLLILFQDDVRRALARAGGVLAGRSRVSDANLLEEVVQAVFALADKRVGALIAIERSASLDPFLEGAQLLDARVSMDLLQAIFQLASPLHDGAIVIRGERIAAAGVFLPLSVSERISKVYGTRHRAAMGLSEQTDAIVLVVSEERGAVGVVEGGTLTPVADGNELRELLFHGLQVGKVAKAVPT
jgi:diadenylate cyclase